MSATVPFWDQWFSDFNAIYLGLTTRKWLLLSDMGNLDNELYGQAEAGKFTPAGIPNVGHFMHEDSPDKFAQAIIGSLTQRKVPTEWNTQMFITNAAGVKIPINR